MVWESQGRGAGLPVFAQQVFTAPGSRAKLGWIPGPEGTACRSASLPSPVPPLALVASWSRGCCALQACHPAGLPLPATCLSIGASCCLLPGGSSVGIKGCGFLD